MRLMFFEPPQSSLSPLFVFFNILKIIDLVKVLHLVHQFNSILPEDVLNTFNFHTIDHSYATRGRNLNLLV